MCGHSLGIAIPLSLLLIDRNDARLLVVDVVALELMQCQCDGSINFVLHTILRYVLHWDVSMLLSGQCVTLGSKLSKCTADAETRVTRLDDIIDIAILGCLIRISKQLVVLFFLFSDEGLDILAGFLLGLGFLSLENRSSTRGTHNGNLSRGPCVVQVGVQLL